MLNIRHDQGIYRVTSPTLQKSTLEVIEKVLPSILGFFHDERTQIARHGFLNVEFPGKLELPNLAAQVSNSSIVGKSFSFAELISTYTIEKPILPLLPFQEEGVAWLVEKKRALLADDMGLGKTFQTLAAISKLISIGEITRVLILCPRSLVFNWYAEIEKWTPYIAATALIPTGDSAESVWKSRTGRAQIIISSYEQLRTNAPFLCDQAEVVVCDEAHRLRNKSSQVSKSFRLLNPARIWMLTGTPVERDQEDFATIFSLLLPSKFAPSDSKIGIELLKLRAKPYILRRRKVDILAQLPPMLEKLESIELSPEQKLAYSAVIKSSSTEMLVKFGKLRQICDIDPVTGVSSKLDRILELLADIQELNERAVVFSYWRLPLISLGERLQERNPGSVQYLTSDMSLQARDRAINRFKSENVTLLASAKIASEGLTLTEANHAIFINRWWNPSSNEQARDRIRRLGQERTTYLYNFISVGTIEERLEEILAKKETVSDSLVNVVRKVLTQEIESF